MLLSTTNGPLRNRFGDEKALRLIKDAGFDAYDMNLCRLQEDEELSGSQYRAAVGRIRAVADEVGLVCNQAHAPFLSRLKGGGGPHRPEMFGHIVRGLECASLLGAKTVVVHVAHYFPHDADAFAYNAEYYKRLEPYARDAGVRIAIENLFLNDRRSGCMRPDESCAFAEDQVRYLDTLNSEWFTVCLDTGHCGLVGDDAERCIRVLGNKKLTALHVHDNDYANDIHTLPYLASLNWEGIAKALGEIDYSGDFTYEVHSFQKRFPDELQLECYRFMATVGRYLMGRIDFYRRSKLG